VTGRLRAWFRALTENEGTQVVGDPGK